MSLPRENVQSYPRPPSLEPVPWPVTITLGGVRIVETDRALRVCETHHAPTYYIPPDALRDVTLTPAAGSSFCEWKGRARYFDVSAGDRTARRAAWSYPEPTPAFAGLAGFLAFYPDAMDACSVAGLPVTPQPGGFYGGWVTPNLAGTVKGAPGTEGW